MKKYRNIAAYKFAPLDDLKSLRQQLIAQCKEWGLKGTILVSTEGLNLFVAGETAQIEKLIAFIHSLPGFENMEFKISESDHQPFNRMLVRIKKEIIAFGVEGIDPGKRTSPKLPAKTLKQWLDEGRPITLLDTRNDYEVKLGTFKNALPIGIDTFREFPAAVEKLPEEMKEQPIVMFCTGGIRCEKAGPFMERQGFKNIFQLEGGILKYFEECGGSHYDGECFVFDQRVGVDPSLEETPSTQCFSCLTPLTEEEQEDTRYVPGKSCPYCFKTSAEQAALKIQRRHEKLARLIDPLPGSAPYDNYRPLNVPNHCDGFTLSKFLTTILKHIPASDWEALASKGLLLNAARQPVTMGQIVKAGERYLHKLPNIVEPDVDAKISILHEDEAIIVLNKPAPLPMHPGGRFNRNTLQYVLNELYHPQKPHPAHRLDANTTGLVLVTRTRHFASYVQPQFARGEVKKSYLVLAQGIPAQEEFFCDAPISLEAGDLGSREVDYHAGLPATTEFTLLARQQDGTSLLEARPLTGRTNQIRVHLWELGMPVVNDPVYLPHKKLGNKQTLDVTDPALCLHAWKMEFSHPLTKERVKFEAPLPTWAPR
ncbi:MAG: sulfurtransferase [Verrucomicrobiales bacterium]